MAREQMIPQDIMSDAERALRSATIPPRCKLRAGRDAVSSLLREAYMAQVRMRGGVPEMDGCTVERIAKTARWLTDGSSKPMLLLYGGVGNGKTTMAAAVRGMHEALAAGIERRIQDTSDRRLRDALHDMRDSLPQPVMMTAQSLAYMATSDRAAFEKAAAVGFLIIDDMGCEPVAVKNWGTEITPLTDILYRRYDGMMTTVVTTNFSKRDIRANYGARVADRFNEVFETIGYTNESYRK